MSDIGKNDFVECVEGGVIEGVPVVERNVYIVADLIDSPMGYWYCDLHNEEHVGKGVLIKEAPVPPGQAWCPKQFKPIHRPTDKLIKSLLSGIKQKAKA